MKFITDFFASLGKTISPLVDFVIDFFTGIGEFFTIIPIYFDIVKDYISLIPTEFIVWGSLFISVSLIFVIIGRRGK